MRNYGNWFFALILGMGIISCGGGSQEHTGHGKTPEKIEVPESYSGSETIQAYLHLKDALVLGDQQKASNYAKNLVASLDGKEGEKTDGVRDFAMKIREVGSLAEQRELFKLLSEEMIRYVQNTDVGIPVYVQHCPMAFDNQGGNWLSAEKEIFNPYYGDKMLHCGVIKDEISAR